MKDHVFCQKIYKHCHNQLRRKYVLESFFEEHCARTICSMEAYDIKPGCLFCHQWDRRKGREKDHDLIISRTLIFDDTMLKNMIPRQVEWASCVQEILSFFQNYFLLMQFTTYAVHTVQSIELHVVRAELVSESSKQLYLIKIQYIWPKLF